MDKCTALGELFGMTRIYTRVSSKMALHAGMDVRFIQMEASISESGKTLCGMGRVNIFEQTDKSARDNLNLASS